MQKYIEAKNHDTIVIHAGDQPMVDWSKLRPYQGFRWKSFEEFCYSIAKRLYDYKGKFMPIDDSGGGDGVEFYLTLPDGGQWGWQAKFYFPNGRLRGRKNQIKESLKRSVQTHPKLEKWFLCTPTNFTTTEIEWFRKLQEKYPDVILEHWGDSEFNDFLTKPLFIGIKNHYVGELELSVDWFRTQVEKQIKNVGNKFIPPLHIETPLDSNVHALLGDSAFIKYLEEQLKNVNFQIGQFEKAVEKLSATNSQIGWQDVKNKLLAYSTQLRTTFTEITKAIADAKNYLSSGQFEEIGQIDWDLMAREFKGKLEDYSRTVHGFQPEKSWYKGTDNERKRIARYIWQYVIAPFSIANDIADLFYMLRNDIETTELHELHIFGGVGIGKTHIACHISQERVLNDLPAILLLGAHFTSDLPIENQILKILNIPSSYSWEDFIQALQSSAETYKTKIPIVIDALNEAQDAAKWKSELPGFAYTLENLSHVVLITTCRSNYRRAIWPPSEPKYMFEIHGFDRASLKEAIEKYFDWYKIKCDLTLAPLRQLSNPIFLRIFCESQNRERKEEKQIYLGEQTLLQIFEDYIIKCNEAVCSKLSRHHSANVVPNALKNVAKELWERKSRYIPISEAVSLIDSRDMEHLDWPNSVTNAILDEGLLINRELINGKEAAFFAYDLLGGYIMAKEIIHGLTSQRIENFVSSEEFETRLLRDDFSDRHPLHEDILRCLALLVPIRFGKHLHELTDDKTVLSYSVRALFEMDPKLIGKSSMELIKNLFSRYDNRIPLFRLAKPIATHTGHPLSIDFWDKLLFDLSIPERDLCWTEYVRRDTSAFFNDLNKFENACKKVDIENLTGAPEQRLSLAAKFFRWLLTSTVRTLRDTATRALYWYGRQFPRSFLDLVLDSLSINDPYVSERMLAGAYGIAMALQYDFKRPQFRESILPLYAKKLYEMMFKVGAPYATTHILSRDYARRLIDIALIHNPEILTSAEKQRITPPFADGGIRDWGESKDRDENSYREGSMPIHMDFGNYTLGRLVRDRGNYNFDNVEYKKVRANIFWRLYNLGYSHNLFKEIDREIHHYNWSGRYPNGNKIDRYGKKYSWIAFYELAGFRQDNDLLPEYYSERHRISDADIDPSFPEPPQKHEVIKTDYMGDRSISLPEWIEHGGIPDLTSCLIVEKLCDEYGPWVLLGGYINQEDLEAKRAQFMFPQGLLVKRDRASKLVGCFKIQNQRESWELYIPEDYYTYAGEIPWSETFPYNGRTMIGFVVSSRTERAPERGVAKLKDGTVLTTIELLALLLKVPQKTEEAVEAFLNEEGIELVETKICRDKEIEEETSFEVLIPVRYYNWETYHSTVNRASPAMVPAKELAEALGLCSKPQTFNLYEEHGKPASITLRWGEPWHTEHRLTYIRQDLIECYLKDNNVELIWAIRGERQFRSKDIEELDEFKKEHEAYRIFQTAKTYTEIKKGETT